jgi:hypothetical protein
METLNWMYSLVNNCVHLTLNGCSLSCWERMLNHIYGTSTQREMDNLCSKLLFPKAIDFVDFVPWIERLIL